jgi:hypothetical protein
MVGKQHFTLVGHVESTEGKVMPYGGSNGAGSQLCLVDGVPAAEDACK